MGSDLKDVVDYMVMGEEWGHGLSLRIEASCRDVRAFREARAEKGGDGATERRRRGLLLDAVDMVILRRLRRMNPERGAVLIVPAEEDALQDLEEAVSLCDFVFLLRGPGDEAAAERALRAGASVIDCHGQPGCEEDFAEMLLRAFLMPDLICVDLADLWCVVGGRQNRLVGGRGRDFDELSAAWAGCCEAMAAAEATRCFAHFSFSDEIAADAVMEMVSRLADAGSRILPEDGTVFFSLSVRSFPEGVSTCCALFGQ